MYIRVSLILMLIFCSCSGSSIADDSQSVETSLGKLLLLHDKLHSYQEDSNPFGSAKVYDEFVKMYDAYIKSQPKMKRIDFFWGSMWHLGFDGHYMVEFQKIITKDCGKEFIDRLEHYISRENELRRHKSRLYLSKKVLAGLKMIQRREKQGTSMISKVKWKTEISCVPDHLSNQ